MKRTNKSDFLSCPICGKQPHVQIFNLNTASALCSGTHNNPHDPIRVNSDYCQPSQLYDVLSHRWNKRVKQFSMK